MPVILGQLKVLPKHWWEGTDASGKKRDIGATTLEPPLGNGAYRIKEFVPGRTVVYGRVKDYWAKDLNVNIGRDNFDEIRYEYFRDPTVALEAFKADHADWRTENSAKNWATAYDFPAVKEKRVILEEFPQRDRGDHAGLRLQHAARQVQGCEGATRVQFRLRLRGDEQAVLLRSIQADQQLLRGHRARLVGLPQGEELEILEPLRDKVPPEVFTTAYANPVAGTPENVRANLREGMRLMREAGYEVRDHKQVNAKTGEALSVEILSRAIRGRSGTLHSLLQALARSPRHRRHRANRRRCPIREPAAQLRLRHHRRLMAAVAVARQRATRLLELAGGRSRLARATTSASRIPPSMP